MRGVLAVLAVGLFCIPGVLAGFPSLAPGLAVRVAGIPLSVAAMAALMAGLVVLAAVCSNVVGRRP